MVVNKRKKFSRQRGYHTHGWGSKKKHRGAGNRGGKGMAGTGKRADSIKTLIWDDVDYFGKHGFKSRRPKNKTINIDYIDEKLNEFVASKLISKEGNVYIVDLKKMGYDKLLGNGNIRNKFRVTGIVSKGAAEKIKKAGGEITG